jgi:hypothetical protein
VRAHGGRPPAGREWSVETGDLPDVDGMLAAGGRARAAGAEVVPADPDAFARVAAVLDRRGGVAAGLGIVPG